MLIFNCSFRLSQFPTQWKCAEILMIPKPSKLENEISSYRPVSLLTIFSKIFERIFHRWLLLILESLAFIPNHQIGFRQLHGNPEQCLRIVQTIVKYLEEEQYCSAIFLDILIAFDTVRHAGLLIKIKMILPAPLSLILRSYLDSRHFYVRINDDTSDINEVRAGVSHGSVLDQTLYTIFTADMPIIND